MSEAGDGVKAGTEREVVGPGVVVRCGAGGVLMGLANLVPGISGGTMLLAAGIYPRFIRAVADVTTLKLRMSSLVVLGAVACAAGLAILLLAGTVRDLVVDHRWIMYSLFIGLTLGGVPLVWKSVSSCASASPFLPLRQWMRANRSISPMSTLTRRATVTISNMRCGWCAMAASSFSTTCYGRVRWRIRTAIRVR